MRHLDVLAREPRPAGGVGTSRARAYCASVLRSRGFEITERAFEFSAFPGAFGAPVAGGIAVLALVVVSAFGAAGRPGAAMGILVVTALSLLVVARWIGQHGVLELNLMRRRAVNLEATRPGSAPRVWLVAHIDSKWQPVPMLVRALCVVLLILCALAAASVAGLTMITPLFAAVGRARVWHGVAVASIVSGLPVLFSVVGARNAGALDNASGVAAILSAAERLDPAVPVGVLITDAEELALAGARAWCRGRRAGVAINCDSVDDGGVLTVMTVGNQGGDSAGLVARCRAAAREAREPLRVIRLIPGVLTDSIAFAHAGWLTVTLSRGNLGTLGTIHTTRDNLRELEGTGIEAAAAVLARVARDVAGSGG